jgi:hypothetical protein
MSQFESNMEQIFDLEKKDQPIVPSTVGDIVPAAKEVVVAKDDADKDYTTVRENLKEIVRRGTEAIDGIMVVAAETQSPRAYEVVATLIKSVSDANKDLIGLHKQIKEIKKIEVQGDNNTSITNNSIFVGSTSELQKMLKGRLKEIDETKFANEQ